MGIARKEGQGVKTCRDGLKHLFPYLNGQFLVLGGVRTLARMFCALYSSFWQCQKMTKKILSEKSVHVDCLTVGGGVCVCVCVCVSKPFGQFPCPYGNNTFQKGAFLSLVDNRAAH